MMETNQKVFKLTSFLLQYPTQQWLNEILTIKLEVDELHDSMSKLYLQSFLHYVETTPFQTLCENYVQTFDYHGIVTLHLTYNVFKDSRQRGEALIKLKQMFQQSNMEITTDELPDYLPLILEFLSVAKDDQMEPILKMHHKSIEKLHEDLASADSDYHFILKAVCEVLNRKLARKDVS